MNGLETRYSLLLAARLHRGEILWWKYEAMTFKLADDTRYTPDFAVLLADGEMEMHETKGPFFRDDAKVKIKVAAELFPFRFILVQALPKREGGGWSYHEY
jgi:hypothetical protein